MSLTKSLILVALTLLPVPAKSQGLDGQKVTPLNVPNRIALAPRVPYVHDARYVATTGGEAQSCVLPPGANPMSPAGRFLVTNDGLRPPLFGTALGPVFSQSLDAKGPEMLQATFEAAPNGQDYAFGTNDHDLLVLSDGSILYVTGAFTKRPLKPKPIWFDVTYRGDFGPGARSCVMTWRSTDGGKTFKFLSEMDPAQVGDGSYAFPQWNWNPDIKWPTFSGYPKTSPPGTKAKPVYDMGGSDGQLTRYDPRTNTLFLTFGGVGYYPQILKDGTVVLTEAPLHRTLVLASKDGGATWQKQGDLSTYSWRFGIVPQADSAPIFATWDTVLVPGADLKSATFYETEAGAGWTDESFYKNANLSLINDHDKGLVYANIWGHHITGRMPGGKGVFLTFPANIPDSKAGGLNGYRLYFFHKSQKEFAELKPILPRKHDKNQVVMHVTAIDLGVGPVFLYWMEVDGTAKTATIRGRFLWDEETSSSDFTVSVVAHKDFAKALTTRTWYGDYWTASGIVPKNVGDSQSPDQFYSYYPMWVEDGGKVVYTEITVNAGRAIKTQGVVGTLKPDEIRAPLTWKKPTLGEPTAEKTRLKNLEIMRKYRETEKERLEERH